VRHDQGVPTSDFLHTMASGPNSHVPPPERRHRQEVIRTLSLQHDGSPRGGGTLLLCDDGGPAPLTPRVNRRWARALSRLLASSLDRKLAEGRPPESHLLLAARAQVLASPVQRQILAYQWTDLLTQAHRSPVARNPRAPINRPGILANEQTIHAILEHLVAPNSGHIRGIALLSRLLSDGGGPVYHAPGPSDLGRILRQAAHLLTAPGLSV
jgi:hypothetical protein